MTAKTNTKSSKSTSQQLGAQTSFVVPYNNLRASESNVRKHANGIKELAESIIHHGLLQSLVVQEVEDGFEVIDGERRRRALAQLVKQKRIPNTFSVVCVAAKSDFVAKSLAANHFRESMHPVDEFRAFAKLREEGKDVATIAAMFTCEPQIVYRRLKLASVADEILEHYRAGKINLSCVMAFTLANNSDDQLRVFNSLKKQSRLYDHTIRQALCGDSLRASDRLVKYIGVDAYRDAGGAFVDDLFADVDSLILLDSALVRRLAEERLSAEAEAVRAKRGYKWAEFVIQQQYGQNGHARAIDIESVCIIPNAEMIAELKAQLKPLEDALFDVGTDESLSDEEMESKCDSYQSKIDAINSQLAKLEKGRKVEPAKRDSMGCLLHINYDGKLVIENDLIKKADQRALTVATNGTDAGLTDKSSAELSNSLVSHLRAVRTAAMRTAIVSNPAIALRMLAAQLLGDIDCGLSIRATDNVDFDHLCNGEASSKTVAVFRQARSTVVETMRPNQSLWAQLLEMDDAAVIRILATRIADSFSEVSHSGQSPRAAGIEAAASALKFDLANHYKPDAEYFGRVSKSRLAIDVAEFAGDEKSKGLAKLKKFEAAAVAAAEVQNTRWVPVF